MKPLCIDLFAGLGGWSEGFLAEGFRCVGFDVERHDYGNGTYPGELVLQDVLTLHGSQFRNATVIVASPPCQGYSYRTMPWKRAKALPPPDNSLFEACFRLQREASAAAGRHIPLIVENVRGAQPWVGRAAWHYGSYYLWGDLPALMPSTLNRKGFGGTWFHNRELGTTNPNRSRTAIDPATKNSGGSWFAMAHNIGIKVPGLTSRDCGEEGIKRPGRNFHAFENGLGSSPSFNGGEHEERGVKQHGSGAEWFDKALDERRRQAGAVKIQTAGGGLEYGGGFGWDGSAMRTGNSKSNARKAASAQIAKIPFALAQWIARCYKPEGK